MMQPIEGARPWPRALGRPDDETPALLKASPEDFFVEELSALMLDGEGGHRYLLIEKRGQNTAWVASELARVFQVPEKSVGYAGLKDRWAVTRQWFSLPWGARLPNLEELEGVVLVETGRHSQKLRRGDHLGNRFVIRLRQVQVEPEIVEARLAAVREQGFPNYFGDQRFGKQGDNLARGMALARASRLRDHRKRGIYLSAMRSWLFNALLAELIDAGEWPRITAGGPNQPGPDGALWGRGRPRADAVFADFEEALPVTYPDLCDMLEHNGLSQERRALRVVPERLQWRWMDNADAVGRDLELSFMLPPGSYATELLDEIAALRDVAAEAAVPVLTSAPD